MSSMLRAAQQPQAQYPTGLSGGPVQGYLSSNFSALPESPLQLAKRREQEMTRMGLDKFQRQRMRDGDLSKMTPELQQRYAQLQQTLSRAPARYTPSQMAEARAAAANQTRQNFNQPREANSMQRPMQQSSPAVGMPLPHASPTGQLYGRPGVRPAGAGGYMLPPTSMPSSGGGARSSQAMPMQQASPSMGMPLPHASPTGQLYGRPGVRPAPMPYNGMAGPAQPPPPPSAMTRTGFTGYVPPGMRR